LPQLDHHLHFTSHSPLGVLLAGFTQVFVQRCKGGHLWYGCQEFAACITHVALHAPLLVRLTQIAVMALKQIITAEVDEGLLLLAVQLVAAPGGIALIARLLLAFFQQLINPLLVGPQDRDRANSLQLVLIGPGIGDRPPD
jgi:hypothetical protein